MREPQGGLQNSHERLARAALRGFATLGELLLGHLEVPVAVLVPDEAVDRACDIVEAVLGKTLLYLGFDALQCADDPAIPRRELNCLRLVQAAVLALGVHEDEARRVPQLVAEVPIALAAA